MRDFRFSIGNWCTEFNLKITLELLTLALDLYMVGHKHDSKKKKKLKDKINNFNNFSIILIK